MELAEVHKLNVLARCPYHFLKPPCSRAGTTSSCLSMPDLLKSFTHISFNTSFVESKISVKGTRTIRPQMLDKWALVLYIFCNYLKSTPICLESQMEICVLFCYVFVCLFFCTWHSLSAADEDFSLCATDVTPTSLPGIILLPPGTLRLIYQSPFYRPSLNISSLNFCKTLPSPIFGNYRGHISWDFEA